MTKKRSWIRDRRRPRWYAVAVAVLLFVAGCSSSPSSPSATQADPTAPADKSIIVAMGDSITSGRDGDVKGEDSSIGGYIPVLQERLYENQFDITIVNQGEPGETSREGVDRFRSVMKRFNPAIVLIMYGTNDMFHKFPLRAADGEYRAAIAQFNASTTANLDEMILTSLSEGRSPMIATLPPICGNRELHAQLVRELNAKIRSLAHQRRIPLVDIYGEFIIRGDTGCDLIGRTAVHPTNAGYRLIASTFYESLVAGPLNAGDTIE